MVVCIGFSFSLGGNATSRSPSVGGAITHLKEEINMKTFFYIGMMFAVIFTVCVLSSSVNAGPQQGYKATMPGPDSRGFDLKVSMVSFPNGMQDVIITIQNFGTGWITHEGPVKVIGTFVSRSSKKIKEDKTPNPEKWNYVCISKPINEDLPKPGQSITITYPKAQVIDPLPDDPPFYYEVKIGLSDPKLFDPDHDNNRAGTFDSALNCTQMIQQKDRGKGGSRFAPK